MSHRFRPRACAAIVVLAGAFGSIPASPADARFGDRVLRAGSHGKHVEVLQRWLTVVGVRTRVDGSFGRRTTRSLRRYEREHRLTVDGVLSPLQAQGLRVRAIAARAVQAATLPTAEQAGFTEAQNAVIGPDGRTALVPVSAPPQVRDAILAANKIVSRPYRYGGGHGRFEDSGYDCSGTVSYALHGAGLLSVPRDSGGLTTFGAAGPGEWMTIYANAGHAYIVIAGLRLDTSGAGEEGPRWRPEPRSPAGYVVRHPRGL
ncbi:MAG TPA: peptidoglycan-binding protein [Solirubrobacteraceae bacterium]|nr:peptidoglycan-binding protein [Solirubrobacteraceae bacterium]